MRQRKRKIRKSLNWRCEKHGVADGLAGVARSHRLIRTEKAMEAQFMRLCSQIRLDENREKRSDIQRNERISKRKTVKG